ncbi:hypothetical protein FHR90_001413 [Endobacter medicaginis]|uniref:HAD family phosphatase n=1 Tax=Endobacter medicaginis TaxID=1181271 RepID=A0A850NKJ3_9PROT|nr:Cof-type HAD-IIB family hydrolase [Endobacter medicaginis]MBB3173590.1 hypothetical protein [Endobacter medicaginis]MCX5475776.1 Cof-type HAD-IIB family hydrolase [Endobacter medicaginis]NVN28999.1 HAD family phosphatase [Endobacter medicaginis]
MSAPSPIRLLVSDIDGTLVTRDKRLTEGVLAAARALREAGIRLALVSARPAHGMDMLLEPLGIDTPRAGLNGGEILSPDGSLLESVFIEPEAAQAALDMLETHGIDAWIFGEGRWYIRNPQGGYVEHEQHAIRMTPTVVRDFTPFTTIAGKIMGSTTDYPKLERVAIEMDAALGDVLNAHRSQPYYLDITHPRANKGEAALTLARLLGVEPEEMACIGDMPNDIAMLKVAGLAIAMGNAEEAVQAHAHVVTRTNEEDGWAYAVREFVLPRAPANGEVV